MTCILTRRRRPGWKINIFHGENIFEDHKKPENDLKSNFRRKKLKNTLLRKTIIFCEKSKFPFFEKSKIFSETPDKDAIIAPTIITDEIALVTDIKGVCSDGVTLHTT